MILVGASGYSYDDWRGHFYPPELSKNKWIEFYAAHLPTVEINYTYYRMPVAKTLAGMRDRTAAKLDFTVKLHGSMTHDRTASSEDFRAFVAACEPLREAGVLGALLAQFPYSFHCTQINRDYLQRLREWLPLQDVVVEMRNARWVKQETFELLKKLELGWCNVDEPQVKGLMPPTAIATSPIGYLRFHGRNAQQWYEHERPEQRYDYLYTVEELAEWTPKLKQLEKLTRRTYAFTNNHFESKAVKNALMLIDLLKQM